MRASSPTASARCRRKRSKQGSRNCARSCDRLARRGERTAVKTAVDMLAAIIPPPAHPVGIATVEDWTDLERSKGFVYPDDVKEINARYGSGWLGGFVWLLSPIRMERG